MLRLNTIPAFGVRSTWRILLDARLFMMLQELRRSVLLVVCVVSYCAATAQRTPKVLFVIADGIAADMLERHAAPTLKSIGTKGGYHRAYVGGEKGKLYRVAYNFGGRLQ